MTAFREQSTIVPNLRKSVCIKITSFFVVPIDYNTKNTVIQSTFSKF